MATKLLLFNAALMEAKERKLASLTEDCSARHALDDVWDNGFLDEVLSEGQWRFATRAVELIPAEDVETAFGYEYAYAVPEDHVRTTGLCEDDRFSIPLLGYQIETGFWYADIDPVYLTYVSNDEDFGGDLSRWPPAFRRFVEVYLAYRVLPRLTGSTADRAELKKDLKRVRLEAKSLDAMESPTRFSPRGSFASSRLGVRSGLERGVRNRLIG